MQTRFRFAICLAAMTPIAAIADNHIAVGDEGVPPSSAPGFIVLQQPQADHVVTLNVRPIAGQGGNPANHVWERTDPAGNAYTEQRSIRWNATASCAEGIDWIRISGPGGTQTQTFNGSRNTIAGFTLYDSFDPDALDAVCLNWGQSINTECANGDDGGCPPIWSLMKGTGQLCAAVRRSPSAADARMAKCPRAHTARGSN